MRQFKVKKFSGEAKKSQLSDQILQETISDFLMLDSLGRQKYALGSGVYKLRIASKSGRGKSGGSRCMLAFKAGDRIIWLHLFDKNDKGNVSNKELKKLKFLADILLALSDDELNRLIKLGEILEVKEHD
ncbi:MAG: type II toxin-antitoxin system RelE/ParE family toxin [Legionella sp.]|nr:type II toxin-antitoxin system RelE/ParE family toxin [Legionella sp.]